MPGLRQLLKRQTFTESIKFWMTHKLTWMTHITKVKPDCMRRLNFIKVVGRQIWGADKFAVL